MGVMFLASIVVAVKLSDKQSALDYFQNYKLTREGDIEKFIFSIIYTTDKECKINYESEKIICRICFKFNNSIGGEMLNLFDNGLINVCIDVDEGATEKQDENKIKDYVEDYIKVNYPIEEVKYNERDLKNKTIKYKIN